MTTAKQLLTEALSYISPPGAWTQGAYAKNARGDQVIEDSADAVCFCSSGALHRARHKHDGDNLNAWTIAYHLLNQAAQNNIIGYNDTAGRTQEQVVDVFKKAIALCPVEES